MSSVALPVGAQPRSLRSFLRLFFVGGLISYRGLFNWIRPAIYIPTMLGSPTFQIIFFASLGRFSGVQDDTFFVVGNGVQVCAMSCIYGMTMSIANERQFGTLAALLGSPANRLAMFLGRGLPVIVNGLLVSAWGFLIGFLFLDFELTGGALPPLVLAVAATVVSCTALGMLIGSIGLRARDVFFASNIAYFLLLLISGANVPLAELPGWMQAIGRAVPLSHGIEAARGVAAGGSLGSVSDLILTELFIGLVYAVIAYALFRFFEAEGRRTSSLDRY